MPLRDRYHDDSQPIEEEFVFCTRSMTICKHFGCVRQRMDDPDSGAKSGIEISNWPDIDADAFETYRSWLYYGSIPTYPADKSTTARFRRLVKAHCLGEVINSSEFLIAVRNAILSDNELQPLDDQAVKYTHRATHEPCILRKFICDVYILTREPKTLDNDAVPRAFLLDLAQSHIATSREPLATEDFRSILIKAGYVSAPFTICASIRRYGKVIELGTRKCSPYASVAAVCLPLLSKWLSLPDHVSQRRSR